MKSLRGSCAYAGAMTECSSGRLRIVSASSARPCYYSRFRLAPFLFSVRSSCRSSTKATCCIESRRLPERLARAGDGRYRRRSNVRCAAFPKSQASSRTSVGRRKRRKRWRSTRPTCTCSFKPRSHWHERSLDELIPQNGLCARGDSWARLRLQRADGMRLDEVISGVKTELGIKIYGDSLPLLQEKADADRAYRREGSGCRGCVGWRERRCDAARGRCSIVRPLPATA